MRQHIGSGIGRKMQSSGGLNIPGAFTDMRQHIGADSQHKTLIFINDSEMVLYFLAFFFEGYIMSKRIERIQITKYIIDAAKQYKQTLLGKTFMYVFSDKYIEVSFRKKDFAHLTGVDKTLSANDFYKEAVNGRLREN
jgi:hypothetical protein